MKDVLFNKGERVYVAGYGWGTVSIDRQTHHVLIDFDNFNNLCGVDVNRNFVSYTEYKIENFSQEKPVNYEEYIGKLGKFWDEGEENFVVGKLLKYEDKMFYVKDYGYYEHFELLSEEQIKVLGLE